jgi:hypothetical protein
VEKRPLSLNLYDSIDSYLESSGLAQSHKQLLENGGTWLKVDQKWLVQNIVKQGKKNG